MLAKSRYLIICRAGDNSLHRNWLNSPRRNFDLFLSYFGDDADNHQCGPTFFEAQKGPKWPIIYDVIHRHQTLIEQYDAIWLPDDDIDMTPDDINKMFVLFSALEMDCAQPALSYDSYVCHTQLLVRETLLAREVNFVEVMAPIMSRKILPKILPTMNLSVSGWGLDLLWPQLFPEAVFGILDATPMRHTRPLGGELYKKNAMSPTNDMQKIQTAYPQFKLNFDAKEALFKVYREWPQPKKNGDGWARLKGYWQHVYARKRYRLVKPKTK